MIQVEYDNRSEHLYLFGTQDGLRALRTQFIQLAAHVPTMIELCSLLGVCSTPGLVIRMSSVAPATRDGGSMLARFIRLLRTPYEPRGLILVSRSEGQVSFDWIVNREKWEGYAWLLDSLIDANEAGTFQYLHGSVSDDADITVELRREIPVKAGPSRD